VKSFKSGITRSNEYRMSQLKQLQLMLVENEVELAAAVHADGKSKFESHMADLISCTHEVKLAIKKFEKWVQPQSVSLGWLYKLAMDSAEIVHDPYGVCLIIGTWNYPLLTLIQPFVGAIASGNCAVLKISEVAENTGRLLVDLIPKYLDERCFRPVFGAVEHSTALLNLRWDLIFYTGNTSVAKVIAKAAAEHLTPCVLELGGKNPVFVDRGVDLTIAAARILNGKLMNCGQTCIAPDYVLLPPELKDEFIECCKKMIEQFYGEWKDQQKWKDYGRLVNDRHWQRVSSYLEKTKGKVVIKGELDRDTKFIGPIVVTDIPEGDVLLQEEVFGPILSVIDCNTIDDAMEYIANGEKPLAAYVFSSDKEVVRKFKMNVAAGAVMANDTVIHVGYSELPFGGVGNSGYGSYHGEWSIKAYTHAKGFLWRTNNSDSGNQLRYPPYSDSKLGWIKYLMG
jgi:aldehyde dehydrogenase (NAD+)